MQIVAGTFSSRTEAESLLPDLERLGIVRSDVIVIEGNDRKGFDREHRSTPQAVLSGALVGAVCGLAIGATLLLLSRVHPVFALGPMALYLLEVVIVTAAGAAIFELWNLGASHDEALLFEEAGRTGALIVAVEVADPIEDKVATALDAHGASDVRRGDWHPAWWRHPFPADTTPIHAGR